MSALTKDRPLAPVSLKDLRDVDPYPAYERIRAVGSVVWDEGMAAWLEGKDSHRGAQFCQTSNGAIVEFGLPFPPGVPQSHAPLAAALFAPFGENLKGRMALLNKSIPHTPSKRAAICQKMSCLQQRCLADTVSAHEPVGARRKMKFNTV